MCKIIHENFLASTLSAHMRPFSIPWMSKYGQYNVEPRYVAYYEVTISEIKPEIENSHKLQTDSLSRQEVGSFNLQQLLSA